MVQEKQSKNNSFMLIHDEQREQELQILCRNILSSSLDFEENPNGADWYTCPFCKKTTKDADKTMMTLNHHSDCPYLIAKSLSTNLC